MSYFSFNNLVFAKTDLQFYKLSTVQYRSSYVSFEDSHLQLMPLGCYTRKQKPLEITMENRKVKLREIADILKTSFGSAFFEMGSAVAYIGTETITHH